MPFFPYCNYNLIFNNFFQCPYSLYFLSNTNNKLISVTINNVRFIYKNLDKNIQYRGKKETEMNWFYFTPQIAFFFTVMPIWICFIVQPKVWTIQCYFNMYSSWCTLSNFRNMLRQTESAYADGIPAAYSGIECGRSVRDWWALFSLWFVWWCHQSL